VIYFQSTVPLGNETPFEVKGVTVQLNSDMTQISGLASSESTKVCVNQKCSEETESQKQSRLQNARKYRKAKQTGETETEKQTRLENAREYRIAKRASETQNEKQPRHENAWEYQKAKRASEIEKQPRLGNVKSRKKERRKGT
jgi:hypothetical protein